jgi:hypothetical protein
MLRLDEADPGSFDRWPTVRVTETTAHHPFDLVRPDTDVCLPSDAARFLVSSLTEAPNDP